ncbi:MAG: uroporphyrinogen-III C-methyltransferase [Proteobacteria bacterium]|nr:uroporphyrinogen-III C-methyltransferase [Pseudomonadota bacterium]
MRYFPVFLDLAGRWVLVVGGGEVAARKVALLRESGARVRVVAPALGASLAAACAAGEIEHHAREFVAGDVDGVRLVIAATDAPAVNRAVAAAAESRQVAVNVVDDLELSTGILPAIVDRSPIVVAVSTSGTAPALARRLRAEIDAVLDGALGRLAQLAASFRGEIRARIRDLGERRRFYDWLVDGAPGDLVRRAREPEAAALVARALAGPRPVAATQGRVTLVGAGPGEAGLLTLAGLRALQCADVILYDRLVSPEVLALARREAERIEVGKSGGGDSVPQAEIQARLVAEARRGRHVVRLKGGDPMVFGRGGEELQHLRAAGIPYEVVPGITAALACSAYAGIPLTHREHASGVRFVTAHSRGSIETTDWRGLAAARETLAVYMGIATLPRLVAELTRHGRAPTTPVAIVENGGRAEQRVLVGTLGEADVLATRHAVCSPALLIVGEVAALAPTLHWYGAAPLTDAAPPARAAVA